MGISINISTPQIEIEIYFDVNKYIRRTYTVIQILNVNNKL